jgi:hypothetical protein
MDFASDEVVNMGLRAAKLLRNFAGCQNFRRPCFSEVTDLRVRHAKFAPQATNGSSKRLSRGLPSSGGIISGRPRF